MITVVLAACKDELLQSCMAGPLFFFCVGLMMTTIEQASPLYVITNWKRQLYSLAFVLGANHFRYHIKINVFHCNVFLHADKTRHLPKLSSRYSEIS